MTSPLISVAMCVMNGEKFIAEAIRSILSQTYAHFELIIVNDGSTDNTAAIIDRFDDPRIVKIKFQNNQGISSALNAAIAAARGDYIARMDADDTSLPERFATQVKYMEANKNLVALGCSYYLMDARSKVLRKAYVPLNHDALHFMLLLQFPFCNPSLMLRKSILDKYNITFSNDYPVAEDYDFLQRLSKCGELGCTKEYLFNYRTHGDGVSKQKRDTLADSYLKLSPPFIAQQLTNHTLSQAELSWFIVHTNKKQQLASNSEIKRYLRVYHELIVAYQLAFPQGDISNIKKNVAEVLFKKVLIKDRHLSKPLNLLAYLLNRHSLFWHFLRGLPQLTAKMVR